MGSEKLPADMMLEILSRASFETVERCKAVSKGLRRIIYDPSFLPLQRKRTNHLCGYYFDTEFVSSNSDSDHNTYSLRLPRSVLILASCDHGILCCMKTNIYYVCKPATQQWQALPSPSAINSFYPTVAFALVVIKSHPLRYNIVRLTGYEYEFEIFDSQNWKWEQTQGPTLASCNEFIISSKVISVGESVHYITSNDNVLAFNIKKRTFRCFSLPKPGCNNDGYKQKRLVKYEGGLGLSCVTKNWERMDVWVVEGQRWARKMSVDMKFLQEMFPVTELVDFISTDVAFMKTETVRGGVLCNFRDRSFKEINVPRRIMRDYIFRFQSDFETVDLKGRKREDYIALGAAGILFITAIISTIFFLMKRKKMKRQHSIKNEADCELQRLSLSFRTATDNNKVSFDGSHHNFDDPMNDNINLVQSYTFAELQKATNNFSSSHLIEGSVYHARLNGEDAAVKRVPTEAISRIEFHLSYQRIGHHPNMIRVLGTSATDGLDSFVVLEYARNGSLKDWIHGGLAMKNQFIASCYRFLNWKQRLKICLDVANALQFLHCSVNLCHVCLSVRNIFLDEEFNAKVGCLGLALTAEQKNYEEGYLAPEVGREGVVSAPVSPSVDVFAFGVVVLEVLSGRAALRGDGRRLSDEIKTVLRSENAEELREWMDCRLGESYSFDGVVKVVNLARSCVEDDAVARPSSGEIAAKLLNLVEELAAEG